MARAEDEEAAREADRFRPNTKPLALAVGANVLLAALCLGAPYLRGQAHARGSLDGFARFAACLYDGEARPSLGLGLPGSTNSQFASTFLRAGADWPERCRSLLDTVAPPDVTFVWPSVKQGGAEVRAAVGLVKTELDATQRARSEVGSRRAPTRVLAAIERLRAGLTLLARAANVEQTIDDDAIAFSRPPALADPARLPLYAGASAALTLRAHEDGVETIALDGGGISWLRVAGGQVSRRRLARSSLVRGVVQRGAHQLLVWAMPPERCLEREDRCVQRAMGVARFQGDEERLPAPVWLAAHPGARADRAVVLQTGDVLDVLALRSAERDLEVRRFVLRASAPPPMPEGGEAKPSPNAAFARFPLPVKPTDALLVPGAVLYAAPAEGTSTAFSWAYAANAGTRGDPAGATEDAVASAGPVAVSTVAGTRAWLSVCERSGVRWMAHGTESALAISRIAVSGTAPAALGSALPPAPPPALTLAFALDPGAWPEDARHDRVQLSCTNDSLALVALDAGHALTVVRCDATTCSAPRRMAQDVRGFAVADDDSTLVVATTGAAHPEISVHRLGPRGEALGAPDTPSVCWDPLGGMCGQPVLAAAHGRLVLGARDGADLLALESLDGGNTWRAMRGIQAAGAGDVDAVMRQHRARHAGRE